MSFYVLFGLPASGKTSFACNIADKNGYKIHSYDDIYNIMKDGYETCEIKKKWINSMKSDILSGNVVICDCICLKSHARRWLLRQFEDVQCKKYLIVMPTPVEECIIRNSKRDNTTRVSENYIRALAKYMHPPTKEEGWDEIIIYRD